MAAQQNLIYIYDLPKESYTSVKLSKIIEEKIESQFKIKTMPQVRRDAYKPFYSAIIKIEDNEAFKKISEGIRYFEFEEGKYCRALPFDREFLGKARADLHKQNVFVRALPKDLEKSVNVHQDLHNKMSEYGTVKSLKVSLNPDYSSRGYGFATFQSPEEASQAVTKSNPDKYVVLPYNPKDRKAIQRVYNNVFVKDFPKADFTEDDLRKLCEPFGKVTSAVVMTSPAVKANPEGETLQYGFVCFENPEKAQICVKELHDKTIGDATKPLYCQEALKKDQRKAQLAREQQKFKNSKKRCNLYVKNFPADTTEERLRQVFGEFGDIESLKLYKNDK